MALSIKNVRAEQLAREVAAVSGDTLTQAVLRALEERLERLKGRRNTPDLVETLLTISNRCGALPDLDSRSADEILGYGPDGSFH
jgi:antitoxin VapB